MLYYFVIDQLLEGFTYSWITIIFFPMYSRYGILSFLASIIYVAFFVLFYFHIYVMISVCTKVEMKFEREVEQKVINSDELNYLNSTDWKKTLYIIQNKFFI